MLVLAFLVAMAARAWPDYIEWVVGVPAVAVLAVWALIALLKPGNDSQPR